MASDKVTYLDDIRDIPTPEHNGNKAPAEHTWRPLNLIELAANPPEPPTIAGLLYPGKRTVLSGETESMKTWFALILCKAELDAGHPVAWADLDAMGPGAMLQRLELLGVDRDTVAHGFHYIEPSEQLDPAKKTDLVDLIESQRIRLFVIDAFNPILNLHELDPNATTDIEKFWRGIADPLCNAGAAVVLLDHVAKNAETRGKYSYGSERKASGAIVHLGFKLLEPLRRGGIGRSLLSVHKDRPGNLPRPTLGRLILDDTGDGPIAYQIEPDKSHDAEGEFRPTVLMQKVSIYLEHADEPATGNEIEKSVTGNGPSIRAGLEILARDGYIRREQGPRRAHLYSSIRPYREADDTPQTTSSPLRPDFVLNLRSEEFVHSSHPLRGDEDDLPRPLDEHHFVPALHDGDPIPEYEHPPIDDSIYDPERDPEHTDRIPFSDL